MRRASEREPTSKKASNISNIVLFDCTLQGKKCHLGTSFRWYITRPAQGSSVVFVDSTLRGEMTFANLYLTNAALTTALESVWRNTHVCV